MVLFSKLVIHAIFHVVCRKTNVILVAQNMDDIPFDLRSMNSVIYGGQISKLREELPKKLLEYIAEI